MTSFFLAAKCDNEIEQEIIGMCFGEGSVIWDQVTRESPTFPIPLSPSLFISAEVMAGTPAATLDHEVTLQMETTC